MSPAEHYAKDQPPDHRAEAAKTLDLAVTWLAAVPPNSGMASAFALIGIGHALLAGSQPTTVQHIHAPNYVGTHDDLMRALATLDSAAVKAGKRGPKVSDL